MKNLFTLIVLLLFASNSYSQTQNQVLPIAFDPATQPVAIEIDSALILNTVSDYLLIKSLKTAWPNLAKIVEVERITLKSQQYLLFKTVPTGSDQMPIFIHIPLVKDGAGQYFIGAGANACSGCSSCRGCSCSGGDCKSEGNTPASRGIMLAKIVPNTLDKF